MVAPESSGGVLPCQRLLIRQQQALVRGEELSALHEGVLCRQPTGCHESQRLVHTVGQLVVPGHNEGKQEISMGSWRDLGQHSWDESPK